MKLGAPTLVGIPYDAGSSFLRGAATAPSLIRQALRSPSSNSWTESLVDVSETSALHDAGDAALDAIFPSARDRLTFPELLIDGYEPHKVKQIFLGFSDRMNIRVDIGDTLELKKRALLAHPSQIAAGDVTFIEQWSREAAAGEGCEFAEAFFRIRMDDFPAEEG